MKKVQKKNKNHKNGGKIKLYAKLIFELDTCLVIFLCYYKTFQEPHKSDLK